MESVFVMDDIDNTQESGFPLCSEILITLISFMGHWEHSMTEHFVSMKKQMEM